MNKTHITTVLNTSRRCNFRWPPFYMKLLHLFANIIGIMDINPITTSYNERLRFTTVYAACNCSEYIVFAAGISCYFSSQYLEAVRDCLVLYQLYCVWQCRIDLSFIACLSHIPWAIFKLNILEAFQTKRFCNINMSIMCIIDEIRHIHAPLSTRFANEKNIVWQNGGTLSWVIFFRRSQSSDWWSNVT